LRRRTRRLFGIAAVAILLLAGCRQNMHDQPKNQTFEESDFFADGQASRPLPAHTVARGELRDDVLLATGVGRDGRPAAELFAAPRLRVWRRAHGGKTDGPARRSG